MKTPEDLVRITPARLRDRVKKWENGIMSVEDAVNAMDWSIGNQLEQAAEHGYRRGYTSRASYPDGYGMGEIDRDRRLQLVQALKCKYEAAGFQCEVVEDGTNLIISF